MAIDDIVSTDQSVPAGMWLKAAQATVRRFCGWHIAPSITQTVQVTAHGGRRMNLPSGHVTAIVAISFQGCTLDPATDIDWSPEGAVMLRRGLPDWPDVPGGVSATITHGWDVEDVPEIMALIASIAQRASSSPAAIASQSVNGASVTFRTSNGAPLGVPLLQVEKDQLAPFAIGRKVT